MKRWITLLLLPLALLLAVPAGALTLDEARAQGLVGERADGYVGVVANGSGEVQALVNNVNSQRRAAYAKIASNTGAPIDAVAAQAGAKLIAQRPAGEWVTDAGGKWRKK